MTKKVKYFLIEYKKGASRIFFDKNLEEFKPVDNLSILVGYSTNKLIGKNYYDGEYIKLNISNTDVEIINDPYGSYPIFLWNQGDKTIISNAIDFLATFSNIQLKIDSSKIYEYFIIGYSILSQTIYKDIICLEPGSKICLSKQISIDKIYKKSFLELENLNSLEIKEITKAFKDSISSKLDSIDRASVSFGLTSGHDSLLGGIVLKSTGNLVDTVTMGDDKSEDINIARERHKLIFGNFQHIELETKDLDVNESDFDSISKICGGMTTLGAASLFKMHKTLRNIYNKKYFLDCTHFEIMRKKLTQDIDFLDKYTTPDNVVENIFINSKIAKELKHKLLKKINHFYKERSLEKFYHYDRNVFGQNYKSLIMNELGGQRICLIHDQAILENIIRSKNYKNSHPYWEVLKQLTKETNLDISTEVQFLLNAKKSLAFNNHSQIYLKEDYFIDLLDSNLAKLLKDFFNIDLLKSKIKNKNLINNEDWFLLRITALLSFGKNHNIGIT